MNENMLSGGLQVKGKATNDGLAQHLNSKIQNRIFAVSRRTASGGGVSRFPYMRRYLDRNALPARQLSLFLNHHQSS